MRFVKVTVSLCLALGCSSIPDRPLSTAEPLNKTIYLVSYGYHTSIILRAKDIPKGTFPLVDAWDTDFVEIGWGDRDWFIMADPGIGVMLRAIFLRTPSAIGLARLSPDALQDFFDAQSVVELEITASGYRSMLDFVQSTFVRDPSGSTLEITRRFRHVYYESQPHYHMFNTCNVMVARALRAAGVPVRPWRSTTAGGVMGQAQAYGKTLK